MFEMDRCMVRLVFIFLIGFGVSWAQAAQKAKIVSPEVEVYAESSFDADVLEVVNGGETYLISDKVYGPFYKIKLKSGRIGYIPDTEVEIPGKPRLNNGETSDDPFLQDVDITSKTKKNNKKSDSKKNMDAESDETDEDGFNYRGFTVQLINLHEDTLGGVQIDDVTALGYKTLSDEISWELMGAFKTPKYYSDKLNASVKAYNIWGDFGVTRDVPLRSNISARYGGALFSHFSWVNVETNTKKYDMQDLTVGLLLEGGFFVVFKKVTLDFSVKYFFDRNSYGGLGASILF